MLYFYIVQFITIALYFIYQCLNFHSRRCVCTWRGCEWRKFGLQVQWFQDLWPQWWVRSHSLEFFADILGLFNIYIISALDPQNASNWYHRKWTVHQQMGQNHLLSLFHKKITKQKFSEYTTHISIDQTLHLVQQLFVLLQISKYFRFDKVLKQSKERYGMTLFCSHD